MPREPRWTLIERRPLLPELGIRGVDEAAALVTGDKLGEASDLVAVSEEDGLGVGVRGLPIEVDEREGRFRIRLYEAEVVLHKLVAVEEREVARLCQGRE